MKQPSLYTLLVLIFFALSGCFGSGEPSEKEMRSAYQARIDVINDNLESYKKEPLEEGNPLSALRRLTGELVGDARIKLVDFEKLSAVPAQGEPGYICDFIAIITMEGKISAHPLVKELERYSGVPNQGRFIKTKRGWMYEPR